MSDALHAVRYENADPATVTDRELNAGIRQLTRAISDSARDQPDETVVRMRVTARG